MSLGSKVGMIATVVLAANVPVPVYAQGFGKSKHTVVLHRKLPPIAHLPGGTVGVAATAREARFRDLAANLGDMLETELTRDDKSLNVDKARPDTVVTCSITNVSTPPPTPVKRTVLGDNRPHTFLKVSGLLSVAYQAKSKAGRLIDSDNITARFTEEYDDETGGAAGKTWSDAVKRPFKKIAPGHRAEEDAMPQNPEELQHILLSRAIAQIAAHLVNTDERITVMLARGKMDESDRLAESGLFSRMLENLETMAPLPKKEDDAYRLYNIGVAYEALAYQAEDPKSAKKFLGEAAISYGKAIDAKPGEKYFVEPQQRIETAIAHYRKLQAAPASAQTLVPATPAAQPPTRVPASGAGSGPASGPAGQSAAGGALTNDQVIQLTKAGLEENNVIGAIKAAQKVQFDLTANGQLTLTQAGVSNKVIAAMREKSSPAPARRKTTTTKKSQPGFKIPQ